MSSVSPLVSVIIPCYNRADIIAQAIGSVRDRPFRIGNWSSLMMAPRTILRVFSPRSSKSMSGYVSFDTPATEASLPLETRV